MKHLLLAFAIAVAALLAQQLVSAAVSIMSLVPEHAQNVQLLHGKILLDGTREMRLSDLPRGEGLFYGTAIALVLVLLGVFLAYKKSMTPLGLNRPVWRGAVYWAIAIAAFMTTTYLLQANYPTFRSQAMDDTVRASVAAAPVLSLMGFCILAPIFEELIFRGVLFHALASNWGSLTAAVATSVLFGIAHFQYSWLIMVFVIVFAALLAGVRASTRSSIPSILIHVINNIIAAIHVLE